MGNLKLSTFAQKQALVFESYLYSYHFSKVYKTSLNFFSPTFLKFVYCMPRFICFKNLYLVIIVFKSFSKSGLKTIAIYFLQFSEDFSIVFFNQISQSS